MRLLRRMVIALVLVAGCSRSSAQSNNAVATAEEPWGHAWSGAPDGWWRSFSLDGKAPPYGVGTRFEVETLGPHDVRTVDMYEIREIIPQPAPGIFEVVLQSSDGGELLRGWRLPPDFSYSPGNNGVILSRNEKLVSVTVPAGTFVAGRLWRGQMVGSLVYERDEWVVPEIPFPIQTWSRPVNAKELYNPPADGTMPEGTTLTRLVRIEQK